MKLSEEEILSRFGSNLSKLRQSKNLTLRELAEKCNVHFANIGKMERGTVNVSLLTLVELANGLGIHPKKLLEFDM